MDLVVQNTYHGVDSPILTITSDVYSLVVAGAYHDLTSPLLYFFWIPDGAGGEDQNYIELVSGHITLEGQVHILTVQEAAHTLVSDVPDLSISYELWTTWPDGMTFPLPELTAQGNERLSGDVLGQTPPIVLTDMRMGSRAEADTPLLECSGSMSSPVLMTVTGRIPQIEGSARDGIKAGAGVIPVIEITASSSETLCRLDANIPLLTVSIEMTTPVMGTMEGDLPFPEFAATVSYHHLATLSANIPIPRLTTTVGVGGIGTLERNIPELRLTASAYVESMFVTGYVPLPVLNLLGTGGIGGIPGIIYDENRFTDYVLRHVR